jgi:hypothetical protein
MVVEGCARDPRYERLSQCCEVRPRARGEFDHDQTRNWQIVEGKSGAEPRLDQACGFILGVDPYVGDTRGSADDPNRILHIDLDVAARRWSHLDGDFAAHVRLPVARRVQHQHRATGRERG